MASATIQQIIFSPANYFKRSTIVQGTVVLIDRDLGRIDISDRGARIIVEIGQIESIGEIVMSSNVLITGVVKKQQRRTFIVADKVDFVLRANSESEA